MVFGVVSTALATCVAYGRLGLQPFSGGRMEYSLHPIRHVRSTL